MGHITIKMKNEKPQRVIALLHSGADKKSLLSDIIPVKLWEKCATLAKGVDGNPLDTSLLVRDIHVCKDNLCIAFAAKLFFP
jgi:hypothetical protein